MKSGGFQVKSTPNLIKSDVSTKTLQFAGCMEGGYDPRFHEIQGHSPSPAFIKLNSFCWNIWFYKVLGGFHVKSKDHLQGIVTLCFVSFFFFLHGPKREKSHLSIKFMYTDQDSPQKLPNDLLADWSRQTSYGRFAWDSQGCFLFFTMKWFKMTILLTDLQIFD